MKFAEQRSQSLFGIFGNPLVIVPGSTSDITPAFELAIAPLPIFTLFDTCFTQNALKILSEWVETIVLTIGEKGALISHSGDLIYIDPLLFY